MGEQKTGFLLTVKTYVKKFLTKCSLITSLVLGKVKQVPVGYMKLAIHMKIAIAVGVSFMLISIIAAVFSMYPKNEVAHVASNSRTFSSLNKTPEEDNVRRLIPSEVNNGLSDIQAKLANIEGMLSSRRSVVNIDKVRTDLHALGSEVKHIEQLDKNQYSALRSQINSLSSQLGDYQKMTSNKLNEIEDVRKGIKCLGASHLPFQIESIDMVNGRDVVSVMYASMVSPLENGFSLAGWKLKKSDYEHQSAMFVNHKGTCVSVNLGGNF